MNITVVPVLPKMELLAAGLHFSLFGNSDDERIRTYTTSRLRVRSHPNLPYSIDGEPSRSFEATFEIVPAAIGIACGEQAVAIDCAPKQASVTLDGAQ